MFPLSKKHTNESISCCLSVYQSYNRLCILCVCMCMCVHVYVCAHSITDDC